MLCSEHPCLKRLLLVVKVVIVVLMNVTFASSRKVAKKGVDVNVHVKKLRAIASFVVFVSCVS